MLEIVPTAISSAVLSTMALAAIGWLLRGWISARLTGAIRYEYDAKLEAVRTENRNHEEEFRADLRAKERQLGALQSGVLANITTRQAAFAARRLEAVDRLWAIVVNANKFGASILVYAALTPEAMKETKEPEASNLREVLRTFGDGLEEASQVFRGADKERPYLSEIAWAYFDAYRMIVVRAVSALQLIHMGADAKTFLPIDSEKRVIKAALPDRSDYIDKYGHSGIQSIADELKRRLLDELRNVLENKEEDESTIKRAAEVLEMTEQVQRDIAEQKRVSGLNVT